MNHEPKPRKIRLGGVGIGRGEGLYGTASYDHRVQLVAICDLDMDVHVKRGLPARYESRGIKIEKLYDNFDEFLQHDMDAVAIATPPACHAEQSIKAMNAGMHVISEIPTAMNVEEAKELVKTVRKTGKFYMTAENVCYSGLTQTWRKIVQDGRIGKPFYAEGEYLHDLRYQFMRSWTDPMFPENPLAGPDKPTWRTTIYPARYCTHEIGPLLEILNDRVVRVMATDTGSNVSPQTGTTDLAVALMKTAGGVTMKELVGFCMSQPHSLRYFCMYGTKGSLETERWGWGKGGSEETLAYFEDIPNLRNVIGMPVCDYPKKKYPAWVSESGHGGIDGAMILDFIDCIADGKPSPIDVYRGLDYSLPGILAAQSAKEGSVWLEVPDPRKW